MATLTSLNKSYPINMMMIDFNWYSRNESGYTFNDFITYQIYRASGDDGFERLRLDFTGSGIKIDGDGAVISGVVNTIAEADVGANTMVWQLAGISISAVSLYQAALTQWNGDELALLSAALSGNDTLDLSNEGDVGFGYDGNDLIFGRGGDDALYGGNGNDQIDGGDGDDDIDGGSGMDLVRYLTATSAVVVDLSISGYQNTLGAGNDRLTGIEYIAGSPYDDTLTGDALDNIIQGANGNDKIYGGEGADTLLGNAGDDSVFGGAGKDTLYGNDGADTLDGGLGDDQIDGGAGIDTMSGGSGNDTYFVDDPAESRFRKSFRARQTA